MIIYSKKYYTKYQQIVKHYKDLDLNKLNDLYTESHHILPKCMGGSDTEDNLVRVPARVHFLLHWMLYRIYRTSEMACAWNMMCSISPDHTNRYTSKSFEYSRKVSASFASARMKGNKLFLGKQHTKESKSLLSQAGKRRTHSDETKLKISKAGIGRIHTEETKKKIALSNIGWNHSSETKKKLSKQKLGKTLSDEHRAKIKQGLDRRYGRIINDCS